MGLAIMQKMFLLSILVLLLLTPVRGDEHDKILVIGSGKDFRPAIFLNEDGLPDGIHIELWNLMGERGGFKPEFRLDEWHNCIPALMEEKVDLVHGVSYTEARAEKLDFSKVIYEYSVFIFFDDDVIGINDIHDLNGLSVGVQKGDGRIIETIKKETTNTAIVEYASIDELLEAAETGIIKVLVYEESSLLWNVSRAHKDFNFRRSSEPLFVDKVYAAVRKGDAATLERINRSIDMITPADLERINEGWYGVSIYDPLPVKQIKTITTVALSIVFLLLAAGIVSLRIRGNKLKILLEERKAIFLDLHHHVRNNLTVLLGFIELQKKNHKGKASPDIFEDLSKKIYTIASVHNQISKDTDIWRIDLARLLNDVVENVQDLNDKPNIKIDLHTVSVPTLPLTKAVSFGLLVNEIIDNTFTHAFENDEEGLVSINLTSSGDTTMLAISDNGKGIDAAVLEAANNPGIDLIHMLAHQIDGEVSFNSGNGCAYDLTFKNVPEADHFSVGAAFTRSMKK